MFHGDECEYCGGNERQCVCRREDYESERIIDSLHGED
jgi:hypothetical protein